MRVIFDRSAFHGECFRVLESPLRDLVAKGRGTPTRATSRIQLPEPQARVP